MFFQQRFGRSAIKYAWITPAVVALALVLIWLFGNGGEEGSGGGIRVVEESSGYQRVQLGGEEQFTDLREYAALDSAIRQEVLHNLSEFRAEYKLVGPLITPTTREELVHAKRLVKNIGNLLAHYNLGEYKLDADADVADVETDATMVLYAKPQDRVIARRLVKALSPMLRGDVLIIDDNSLNTGHMVLRVTAEPGFTPRGVAVL